MSDEYLAGSNNAQQTSAEDLMTNEKIIGITKAAGHRSMF